MSMLRLSIQHGDYVRRIAAVQMDTVEKITLVLEQVGIETIAYLRSLTNEIRPPVKEGDAERRAHPGHWADRSGQLAGAYSWEIERRGRTEMALIFRNTAEHAMWLEVKEGFFVLHGVTEPGGPVQQALKKVIPQIAPGWTVRLA
jgi:hypothetical protein